MNANSSTEEIVTMPSDWEVGYTCHICYSNYQQLNNPYETADYRQKVMECCAENLFTEITGDEFDWNLIISNQVLPFCPDCWEANQKIYEFTTDKENTENEIDHIVSNLSTRVLANRKYLKKTGALSSKEPKTTPGSMGQGIKIEGISMDRKVKCKLCHNMHTTGNSVNIIAGLIELDMSQKIMHVCEYHLYPELIDETFYDWDSLPFNNVAPFCTECSRDLKSVVEMDDKLKEIDSYQTDCVDIFTLKVLKCRKALKRMGRFSGSQSGSQSGFRDDRSVSSVSSIDSQDTMFNDEDDEVQIVGISKMLRYPRDFKNAPAPSDPLTPTVENVHSIASKSHSGYTEDADISGNVPLEGSLLNPEYSYPMENDSPSSSSVATCVVAPLTLKSPVRSPLKLAPRKEEATESKVALRVSTTVSKVTGQEITSITPGQSTINILNPSVTLARLAINKSGKVGEFGSLFTCRYCRKSFVFRKCWEQHNLECDTTAPISRSRKSCCGLTFPDKETYKLHRLAHTQHAIPISPQTYSNSNLNSNRPPEDNSRRSSPIKVNRIAMMKTSARTPSIRSTKSGDSRTREKTLHSGGKASQSGGKASHSGGKASHSGGKASHSGGKESHSGGKESHSGEKTSHSGEKTRTSSRATEVSYKIRPPDYKDELKCIYCPKLCHTKTGMALHIRSHSKMNNYKCRLCGESFSYPGQMKAHNRNYHTNIQCPPPIKSKLPKNGKQDSAFWNNTLNKSPGRKTGVAFSCAFCTIPIINKKHLIDHIQEHYHVAQGQRCEICKMTFSHKSSLRTHNKSLHPQLYI